MMDRLMEKSSAISAMLHFPASRSSRRCASCIMVMLRRLPRNRTLALAIFTPLHVHL